MPFKGFIETLLFYCFLFTSIYDSISFYQIIVVFNTIRQNVTFIINFLLFLLLFFEAPNYHENPYIITKTQGSFRVCNISPILRQHFQPNLYPFPQKKQYPAPFCFSALYNHGNPRLLRDSILLPDSTIFSPIAPLSAASKKHQKVGFTHHCDEPHQALKALILSHSSILSPVSIQIPMASILNSRLCRC